MLNGVLSLGDIRDVEKLCRRIIDQAMRNTKRTERHTRQILRWPDYEDLLAFLIEQSWLLWLRYDPEHAKQAKFSNFAIPQLRCRVLDWQRKKLGRGGSPGEWGVGSTGDLDEDELDRVFGSRDGDDPFARVSDFQWAVDAGGGKPSGLVDARRRAAPRRVA